MITIKTFIGRKLNYINGILRRQIELDRHLKRREGVNLIYEYYNAPQNPLDYFTKRYFFFPYYSWKRSSNKNSINHITFQYLGDLGHFLDKSKTIITCHDIFTFLEKNNLRNPYIIQRYSLSGLRKCRYVISISNFTKNELHHKLKIPLEKIIVIKNGMNQEMFKPLHEKELSKIEPLYPEFNKILHVGSEVFRKDFITLLKAFYLIKKRNKNIKLIRVGQPAYKKIIHRLGLEKDVIYLNAINNERLREIYNLCDIFVYPSLYEGWGAPGLEAAACGTPVICSDIPIFREVYKDFPHYFSPRDYKSLANIIIENINNERLKLEMSRKGFEVLKRYSWKKSAERYLKLTKFVLENR